METETIYAYKEIQGADLKSGYEWYHSDSGNWQIVTDTLVHSMGILAKHEDPEASRNFLVRFPVSAETVYPIKEMTDEEKFDEWWGNSTQRQFNRNDPENMRVKLAFMAGLKYIKI